MRWMVERERDRRVGKLVGGRWWWLLGGERLIRVGKMLQKIQDVFCLWKRIA
jgi:hypothetical protein